VSPFQAWTDKPIYIIWRGSDKSPVDPLHVDPASDYARSDAQNPATWLSWDVAAEYARVLGPGYGVGVVIHEGSGLLCVDIDGCIAPSGELSAIAQKLIADARGAYIEISMSGRGVHIIGPYKGTPPLHSTKNHEHHLELYTSRRYIALTGSIRARPAPDADLTDFLLATAWAYFRPSALAETPATWTTEDDPACHFTGTPAERIAALLNTKSFAARLSPGKVTFADLHNLNVDKLAATWPGGEGKPYDQSSADQAYFNHLAYGFANNCEAIYDYAISGDCPLYREKWGRPDYLRATILKAVAIPKRWKGARAPVAAPVQLPAPPPATLPAVTFATPAGIPQPPATLAPALPVMLVNSKDKYEANLDYVERILESDGLLSFDEFRNAVMIQKGITREVMKDEDYIAMRLLFEREKNFASIGKELMRDACLLVASRRRYDSGIEWLDAQVWDGVPRVERFMHTHFGAADDEYTRAVGRYMWTGLAGRMLSPGCQLDMVIALQSRQGTGKSTGLQALAPDPDYFTDGLSLHEDNDNFKRMMRGKVIVEIAEMAGLSKGDIDVVKRVITRKTEKWIEKYQIAETVFNRRCMLFASTNNQEFLPPDETGQRRWLPVVITEINRALVEADRSQLWAEGAAIYRQSGIAYADAERLAVNRHKAHELSDVWEQRISEWLVAPPPNGGLPPCTRAINVAEILDNAIRMPAMQQNKVAEKRAATVLRALGYKLQAKAKTWVLDIPAPPTP